VLHTFLKMHVDKNTMRLMVCKQQYLHSMIHDQGVESGIQFKSYIKSRIVPRTIFTKEGANATVRSCSFLEINVDARIGYKYYEWRKLWTAAESTHALPHQLNKLFGNVDLDVTHSCDKSFCEVIHKNLSKPRYELRDFKL
jgi:hypothetical protein